MEEDPAQRVRTRSQRGLGQTLTQINYSELSTTSEGSGESSASRSSSLSPMEEEELCSDDYLPLRQPTPKEEFSLSPPRGTAKGQEVVPIGLCTGDLGGAVTSPSPLQRHIMPVRGRPVERTMSRRGCRSTPRIPAPRTPAQPRPRRGCRGRRGRPTPTIDSQGSGGRQLTLQDYFPTGGSSHHAPIATPGPSRYSAQQKGKRKVDDGEPSRPMEEDKLPSTPEGWKPPEIQPSQGSPAMLRDRSHVAKRTCFQCGNSHVVKMFMGQVYCEHAEPLLPIRPPLVKTGSRHQSRHRIYYSPDSSASASTHRDSQGMRRDSEGFQISESDSRTPTPGSHGGTNSTAESNGSLRSPRQVDVSLHLPQSRPSSLPLGATHARAGTQLSPFTKNVRNLIPPRPSRIAAMGMGGTVSAQERLGDWLDEFGMPRLVPHILENVHDQELDHEAATHPPPPPMGPSGGMSSFPEWIWVPLHVLGYNPIQFHGQTAFMGEVKSCKEDKDNLSWYHVDFGGPIGRKDVRVLDCLEPDFWHHPARDGPWTLPAMDPTSPARDGSLDDQVALPQPHMSETIDSPPDMASDDGSDLPTHASGSATLTSDQDLAPWTEQWMMLGPNPMDSNDGWTDDSSDHTWMAEFKDYAGMSDISNSDWALSSDDGTHGIFESHDDVHCQLGLYENDEEFGLLPLRERYADEQWQCQDTSLLGDRRKFTGFAPGPTQRYTRNKPSYGSFFDLFWDNAVIDKFVDQTNLYATQANKFRNNRLNGGPRWYPTDRIELRAWIGLTILMGLKGTPSVRDYWSRDSFFRCPLMRSVMSRDRFEAIKRCLHCVDNSTRPNEKSDPGYDKIGLVRWVVEGFVQKAKELWHPEKYITVDEIIVAYKGHYSPIRQYNPMKPTKYGFKVWAAVSNPSQYIYNLSVYEGNAGEAAATGLATKVVLDMTRGLEHKGHTVVTDQFFTGCSLYEKLLRRGIWATGTLMSNRIGYPKELAAFKKGEHKRGTLFWRMHRSKTISASAWYDRQVVHFLSTSTNPIGPGAFARRWIRGKTVKVPSTPHQVEYQHYMRGVDVTNQMRKDYSCQFNSHKWWHKLWTFVLECILHNGYILMRVHWKGLGEKPTSRKSFHQQVALYLIEPKVGLPRTAPEGPSPGVIHMNEGQGKLRGQCKICGRKQNKVCKACGWKWLCAKCYRKTHTSRKWFLKLMLKT